MLGQLTMRALAPLPLLILLLAPGVSWSQEDFPEFNEQGDKVTLDFQETELTDVITMISRLTKKNFLFDDRVRGRVTVISPSPVTPEEAYRVFEAILQVKGFTTVPGPGGILKIVPLRQAKESPIQTVPGESAVANRDLYITRLLPLRFVKAETIISTLRPLISKDANLIAYTPTNTLILTDTAANIRRLVTIISEIDIETYQEQIKVIPIEYANAAGLTAHLREIFAEPGSGAKRPKPATPRAQRQRGRRAKPAAAAGAGATIVGSAGAPRFITDDRTNSIIVLAPQATIDEVERLVTLLDYERRGTGRIHVYRLQNADAEEMAQTLASLVQGAGRRPGPGGAQGAAAPAAVVARLGEGISVTADAPTNSLIIQASADGFSALQDVIKALDVRRPQVLVEALIMEVNVTDSNALGLAFLFQNNLADGGESRVLVGSASGVSDDSVSTDSLFPSSFSNFTSAVIGKTVTVIGTDGVPVDVPAIQGIIIARASDSDTNIISSPVILTADNEEAQIVVGQNIPIPTTRLQTADSSAAGGFQTSQNIERQDVGVTLRVTPQISEGDTIRLQIYQEISEVLSEQDELGPTTTNRTVENTVFVRDGEAVMIGGILSETETDSVSKVPFLGDIPILGWAFKSKSTDVRKVNLLVVLTPHIVRDPEDLKRLTVEHRERFRDGASESFELSKDESTGRERALAAGLDLPRDSNPVRRELERHERRYPTESLPSMRRRGGERERERLLEIENLKAQEASGNYILQVAHFREASDAVDLLNTLISSGYDGTVLSRSERGETVHLVQVGPYSDENRAQLTAREIRASTGLHVLVTVEP